MSRLTSGGSGQGETRDLSYSSLQPKTSFNDPSSDADDDAEESVERDLNENVYDVAILAAVNMSHHDSHPIHHQSHMVHTFFFAVFQLLANYVFQILLLKWTYTYVVCPQIHVLQLVYMAYHAECYNEADGMYNSTLWEKWDPLQKHKLCEMVFSTTGSWNPFLYVILCLWFSTMFNEIRVNWDMAMVGIGALPTVDPNDEELIHQQEDKDVIMYHSPKMKFFVFAFVIIPKTIISLVLLLIGAMWLSATDAFDGLILNAVALEFVIGIDEVLYNAFTPFPIRKEVGITKIKMLRSAKRFMELVSTGFIWKNYAYYAMVFFIVWLYEHYLQAVPYLGILPGYEDDAACPAYWAHRTVRPCYKILRGAAECFPKGSFPVGAEI